MFEYLHNSAWDILGNSGWDCGKSDLWIFDHADFDQMFMLLYGWCSMDVTRLTVEEAKKLFFKMPKLIKQYAGGYIWSFRFGSIYPLEGYFIKVKPYREETKIIVLFKDDDGTVYCQKNQKQLNFLLQIFFFGVLRVWHKKHGRKDY